MSVQQEGRPTLKATGGLEIGVADSSAMVLASP